VELNTETVLAAVSRVHEETGERVITLFDVAKAISGDQRITAPPGVRVTNSQGGSMPELMPPWPGWVSVLNSILQRLGEEGKLSVAMTATMVFPPE
jgi:hypothetical protein